MWCRLIQSHLYCISYTEMLSFPISLFSPFLCPWLAFHSRYPFVGTFEKRLSQSHVSCVLVGIYLAHHSLTCSWEEIVLPGPSTDSMRERFHRIETEVCLWQIKQLSTVNSDKVSGLWPIIRTNHCTKRAPASPEGPASWTACYSSMFQWMC